MGLVILDKRAEGSFVAFCDLRSVSRREEAAASVFRPQEKRRSHLARPTQKRCRDPRNLRLGAWPAERTAAKEAHMANVSPHLDALDRLLPPPLGAALRPHARIVARQPGHIIMGYAPASSI